MRKFGPLELDLPTNPGRMHFMQALESDTLQAMQLAVCERWETKFPGAEKLGGEKCLGQFTYQISGGLRFSQFHFLQT